jgi:hypothetical protein
VVGPVSQGARPYCGQTLVKPACRAAQDLLLEGTLVPAARPGQEFRHGSRPGKGAQIPVKSVQRYRVPWAGVCREGAPGLLQAGAVQQTACRA